MLIEKFWMN